MASIALSTKRLSFSSLSLTSFSASMRCSSADALEANILKTELTQDSSGSGLVSNTAKCPNTQPSWSKSGTPI